MLVPLALAALAGYIITHRGKAKLMLQSDWQGWVYPLPLLGDGHIPTISDGWASPRDGGHRLHKGADIMYDKLPSDPKGIVKHVATLHYIVPLGTPVLAAFDGTVWEAGNTQLGHHLQLDHGTHLPQGGVNTFYQHMTSFSRNWKHGDIVKRGDILGTVGWSLADSEQISHLHFELWFPRKGVKQADWAVDPAPYLKLFKKVMV